MVVWDAASGAEVLTMQGHAAKIRTIAWSPDGRRLASGSEDHCVKIWDAINGKELLTLDGHTGNVTAVVWSPDGRQLASADNSKDGAPLKLWDATAAHQTQQYGKPAPPDPVLVVP